MADRGRVGVDRLQNPHLHKLVVQQNQGHHQRKLSEIRGRKKGGHYDTLDNANPETRALSHVWYNAKKNELLSLREQDVNSVNNFLLEGIARNKVSLTQHVAVPPKALTALTRIRQLEEITRDNEFLAKRLANTKGVFQEERMAERRRGRTASASRRTRQPPPKTAPAALALTPEQKSELKGKLTSGAYKVAFSNMLARPASTSSVPALTQPLDLAGNSQELAPEALAGV